MATAREIKNRTSLNLSDYYYCEDGGMAMGLSVLVE